MKEKVYIIILNYNCLEDTVSCLDSCLNLTYRKFEIIVVDNNSSDNSVEIIKKNYSNIKLIECDRNLGYARANNRAITYALNKNADFIWILNNDIIVEPKSLSVLVESYPKTPNVGLMGTKILNYNNNTIDYIGGLFNYEDGSTIHVGRNEVDLGQFNKQIIETDFVTGCSVFTSSDVIKRIGLIPVDYFLYCEDVDWSLNARRMGFIHYVNTMATVYHKCSASTKTIKGIITFYLIRNRLFLLEKYSNKKTSWLKRIKSDFNKFMLFFFKFNFRACLNIILAYSYWLLRLTDKRESPKFKLFNKYNDKKNS